MMHLAGRYLDFPVEISTFFGTATAIYTVVDVLSLISAALIFTLFFYYPMRMIVNPRYVRVFWRREVVSRIRKKNRFYFMGWLMVLSALLLMMCTPYHADYVAGYLVPVFFIVFTLGIGRFSYPF